MKLRRVGAIAILIATSSCREAQRREGPASIGETISLENNGTGVAWDLTVLGSDDLGKKITRQAVLSGEPTAVSRAPSLPTNHFERLHLKATNTGHRLASMSPTIMTMSANNPTALYASIVVVSSLTDEYLDPKTNRPFGHKVQPGETSEYWEITEVPDALRMSAIDWGKVWVVVKLGN